ncbi:MAG: adenosylcobalamin-dependent ribonucleoside-diphosphate reductase, partial [Clostridia bacterium]|nr:adenosylcobalamin-dependent ribonucleoside-diphosphate reductase [Clostridia bacterium]
MLSENGQKVFEARYAARDEQGETCESFEQAVDRLAKTAAAHEKDPSHWEKKFRQAISSLFFVPSTPIWANIGKTDRPWQPGACFVLDVEDSLQSMYQTLTETALVFKSGGGVGYNFSKIRPQGSLVHSTKGRASGVVELIKLYDASSNMVMQGGVRRGASMGILNIDHPEILNFINSKLNEGMANFNISVGITDAFMEAVAENRDWDLVFGGQVQSTYKARELWQAIAQAAYVCGDPGLVFLDRIQRDNPIPGNFLNCTNPCGEQPLSPGESCLLGSINLALMVDEKGRLKKDLLIDTVQTAVRFLDNLIDLAEYPLPKIAEATRASRKIGLGFTGLHDALIKSGLAYDSETGRQKAGEIMALIQHTAHPTSEKLGEDKGVFPLWEKSIFYPEKLRRNAACITIAPTGSVTALAGCEGYGIEPIFAVAYSTFTNVAGVFAVFFSLFQNACQEAGVSQFALQLISCRG